MAKPWSVQSFDANVMGTPVCKNQMSVNDNKLPILSDLQIQIATPKDSRLTCAVGISAFLPRLLLLRHKRRIHLLRKNKFYKQFRKKYRITKRPEATNCARQQPFCKFNGNRVQKQREKSTKSMTPNLWPTIHRQPNNRERGIRKTDALQNVSSRAAPTATTKQHRTTPHVFVIGRRPRSRPKSSPNISICRSSKLLVQQTVWIEISHAFHFCHVLSFPKIANATDEPRRRILANSKFAQMLAMFDKYRSIGNRAKINTPPALNRQPNDHGKNSQNRCVAKNFLPRRIKNYDQKTSKE